jgi:hypothetical protein
VCALETSKRAGLLCALGIATDTTAAAEWPPYSCHHSLLKPCHPCGNILLYAAALCAQRLVLLPALHLPSHLAPPTGQPSVQSSAQYDSSAGQQHQVTCRQEVQFAEQDSNKSG